MLFGVLVVGLCARLARWLFFLITIVHSDSESLDFFGESAK